jgi:hypothetical protein
MKPIRYGDSFHLIGLNIVYIKICNSININLKCVRCSSYLFYMSRGSSVKCINCRNAIHIYRDDLLKIFDKVVKV